MKESLLLFIMFLLVGSVQSQDSLKVIKGLVTDQDGNTLGNKIVEARYHDCLDETNQQYTVSSISDEEGYYELWLDVCDNEEIVVIAFCDDGFQSVDVFSFHESSQTINFNFDCNYDYNCDASFSYNFGPPNVDDGSIPFYFTAINPNNEDYFYEWAFLGALGDSGSDMDTPTVYYPTFGQYTVCMQSYIEGDPFNIICEFCQTINADLAFQSFGPTKVNTPNFVQDIQIFPNPTNEQVQLDFTLLNKENLTIEMSNHVGQSLMQKNTHFPKGENQIILDMANYPSGIYFIQMKSSKGAFCKKIIKD